jgi:hypothetical protein
MKTTLETRIEFLENIIDDRFSALPLTDYGNWEGPEPDELTYQTQEGLTIDRLPGEPDDEYEKRAFHICQFTPRRELPLCRIHYGRVKT